MAGRIVRPAGTRGVSPLPERAVIQIAGLTAVVECYASEDDPDQRDRKHLWVLGLVGMRQVLEAI